MPRLLLPAAAGILFLFAGPAAAAAQPATGATGVAGRCDAAPTLEGMLQRNDGVERIVNVPCERLTIGGDAGEIGEVAFHRGNRIELRLAGRWAGDTFSIESVRIGDEASVPVSGPSRCRFYAQGNSLGIAMCFAQYQQGGQKRAVVVAFTAG